MEKSFLISIIVSVHQIYKDYPEKISNLLIPPIVPDLEVSNAQRTINMIVRGL